MIKNCTAEPNTIKRFSTVWEYFPGYTEHFPLLQIDHGTYITGLQIQSGINFDLMSSPPPEKMEKSGSHSVQMGKYNSLAEGITLLIDLNHDYSNVSQGVLDFLPPKQILPSNLRRKCSVLIQNDVWIGHGVTIMGGVTIHNGAVIAANSVITKDVPAYAIVGGNPAKIIRYRYSPEEIQDMLTIAWYNWSFSKLQKNASDFSLKVSDFIQKHLPQAKAEIDAIPTLSINKERKIILLIPDFCEPFSLWNKILDEYFSVPRLEYELLIYIPASTKEKDFSDLTECLDKYDDCDAYVTIQQGEISDERELFKCADYYITTREERNILRTCYADLFQVKLLSGVDVPIFIF